MPIIRRRVMRKRRAMRKGRKAGRAGYRRNKFARKLNANLQDKAVVIETTETPAVVEGGSFISHQLGSFNRAVAVSKNYRFFRCKKVELEFIPYANVFAPGSAFPELYYQVDRVQGNGFGVPIPVPTKNMMLARGVTPVKWTTVIKRSYSPSVLRNENFIQNVLGADVQSVAAVTSTPVLYKWYATQQLFNPPPGNAASAIYPTWGPNSLQYFGAIYYVDQSLASAGAPLGTIKMKVHWEFKQPLWTSDTQAPGPELPALPAST